MHNPMTNGRGRRQLELGKEPPTLGDRIIRSPMDTLAVDSAFPRASRARESCPASPPIESASPDSSISVLRSPARYKPNFSEDEPLFRVRRVDRR